jgi:hypothetical protein
MSLWGDGHGFGIGFYIGLGIGVLAQHVLEVLTGIILLDIVIRWKPFGGICSKFIIFLTFRFLRQKGITKVKDVRTRMGKGANELVQGEVHGY